MMGNRQVHCSGVQVPLSRHARMGSSILGTPAQLAIPFQWHALSQQIHAQKNLSWQDIYLLHLEAHRHAQPQHATEDISG